MKKIMFNDKYGLTQAVLDGRKTMTRRFVNGNYTSVIISEGKFLGVVGNGKDCIKLVPKYKIGEVVAIAQSYSDCGNMPDYGLDEDGYPIMPKRSGFFNKMFVRADLMPHHIRITNIKIKRLQDISDGDCLKEGIEEHLRDVQYGFPSNIGYCGQYPFSNPREAFAVLIDKISGKGTWERNPFVWVYEFKLVK